MPVGRFQHIVHVPQSPVDIFVARELQKVRGYPRAALHDERVGQIPVEDTEHAVDRFLDWCSSRNVKLGDFV